ncbi:type VII secretion-associated serine protease mycosin [Streptomyces sp. NPDC001941]|uniref:type VII secretion-associated serine protease mycosin n=1 Tax=Streptomyces sp. NPDC001941 TaxID=3154659 RepID=UPI0033235FE5
MRDIRAARVRPVAGALALGVLGSSLLAPPSAYASAAAAGFPGRCAERAVKTIPELPWAQARLDLERVWEVTQGAGQKVAVVDSGVDASVPQLKGHVLRGTDVVGDSGRGDTDCVGHGTFVAGVIAARQDPKLRFAGVAPGATVLPVRQTSDGKDGSADGMARAIRAAVDGGARVVNISANAPTTSAALQEAVRHAVREDVLVVASAGNRQSGSEPLRASFPASFPDVLGVGAVGRDDEPAQFSEPGSFVDVAAPGVDIISLGTGGPGYVIDQGTSFAAPFVSGTAALVRAYHPELSVRQVIHRIQSTADRPARKVPDPQVGWGTVNPYRAVTAVLPEERPGASPAPSAAATPAPLPPAPAAAAAPARTSGPFGMVLLVVGVIAVVGLFAGGVLAARMSSRRR